VGDKPGKYWDYHECAWIKWPAPSDDLRVPEQPRADSADADDQTVLGAPI
jgi:hypothetical protein